MRHPLHLTLIPDFTQPMEVRAELERLLAGREAPEALLKLIEEGFKFPDGGLSVVFSPTGIAGEHRAVFKLTDGFVERLLAAAAGDGDVGGVEIGGGHG